MTANDILRELLAELPPKPNSLQVDAYLDQTLLTLCTYHGPMEFEKRGRLSVDLQEPDSLQKVKDWLENIIADLIY